MVYLGILAELFLYWQRATSSNGHSKPQFTQTVHNHTTRLGREFVFFGLHDLSICSCMFCFTLVSWVISVHVMALA